MILVRVNQSHQHSHNNKLRVQVIQKRVVGHAKWELHEKVTERMFESRMTSAWEHHARHSELLQVSQSLELGRVDELQKLG